MFAIHSNITNQEFIIKFINTTGSMKWSELVKEIIIFDEEIPKLLIYTKDYFANTYDNGNFSKYAITGNLIINPETLGFIMLDDYGWIEYHHQQSLKPSSHNAVDIEFKYTDGSIKGEMISTPQELETIYIN